MKSIINRLSRTQEVKLTNPDNKNPDFTQSKEKERKQTTGELRKHLDQQTQDRNQEILRVK